MLLKWKIWSKKIFWLIIWLNLYNTKFEYKRKLFSFNNDSNDSNDVENYICSNFTVDVINFEENPMHDGVWFSPNLKLNNQGINVTNYMFKNKTDIITANK